MHIYMSFRYKSVTPPPRARCVGAKLHMGLFCGNQGGLFAEE